MKKGAGEMWKEQEALDFRKSYRLELSREKNGGSKRKREALKEIFEKALPESSYEVGDGRWAFALCQDKFSQLTSSGGQGRENVRWVEDALHDILEDNMELFGKEDPLRFYVIDTACDVLSLDGDAPLRLLAVLYDLLKNLEEYEECREYYGEEALNRVLKNTWEYWPKDLKKMANKQLRTSRDSYLNRFRTALQDYELSAGLSAELREESEEESTSLKAASKSRERALAEEAEEPDFDDEESTGEGVPVGGETDRDFGEEETAEDEGEDENRKSAGQFFRQPLFMGLAAAAVAAALGFFAGTAWQKHAGTVQVRELTAENEELRRENQELKGGGSTGTEADGSSAAETSNENEEKPLEILDEAEENSDKEAGENKAEGSEASGSENGEKENGETEGSKEEKTDGESAEDQPEGSTDQNGEAENAPEVYHELQTDYNFRAEPNASSESFEVLTQGTRVKILGKADGEWMQAEYNGRQGYIHCGSELAEEQISEE